jgi:uncharacterized protein YeaO (DUF488 family)
MAITIVRLGAPRSSNEGLRLGTVRRPPRGVKKSDFAKKDYYDVWVPDLAPSAQLVSWAKHSDWDDARWKRFGKEYRKEMKEPHAARMIELLAALSATTDFSVGCYCEDENRCHRSVLRSLLEEAGATMR